MLGTLGNILAFDATDGCGQTMHMVSNWHPLGSGQDGHILYMNPSIGPRTIRIAVIQHPTEEGPTPTFTLAHTLRPIGCGDAFVDQSGEQTASEECDDGDQQNGDGCSSTCTVEPGWNCSGAPSWCGLP